ncbi:MAG TPA: Xaa-Pro peptidase family protein [Solirubrobacterales bacterium]
MSTTVAVAGERLVELITERELDQLFVSDLTNVRYLTGFTGTNGACLVSPEELVFFTDFRYTERAAHEVSQEWERPEAERELVPQIASRMSGRVGFEDAKLSVRQLARLEAAVGEDVDLVPAGDLVEQLRAVKEPEEIERMTAASELADDVFRWALERGLAGRTERDVARACEARIRELGAEPSFPPIIAAGENGALPHAEPGEREIGSGELVVFDMGAQLDGYCSDGTRTFATGEPGDEAREVYDLVLAAQLAALGAIRAGAAGKEVDAVARELIAEAGHGDHFGHGLGHGVGLEVHEAPRLATTSEDELRERNAVTVEPGIYLPGRFGVRIEDLVVVTADGYLNLSGTSKELQIVD